MKNCQNSCQAVGQTFNFQTNSGFDMYNRYKCLLYKEPSDLIAPYFSKKDNLPVRNVKSYGSWRCETDAKLLPKKFDMPCKFQL